MQISKTGVRGYLFKKLSKKKTLNNKYKIKKRTSGRVFDSGLITGTIKTMVPTLSQSGSNSDKNVKQIRRFSAKIP